MFEMETTNQNIAEECRTWVYNQPFNDILWYLQEHCGEMNEWAECFKKSFCEMVDTIKKELQEDDDYISKNEERAAFE